MNSLTVIIPVYKNYEIIEKTLCNNLNFLEDAKILIVVDGGDFELGEKIKSLDRRISVFVNPFHGGFSYSANIGIENVKTPYFFLLNSDVFLIDYSFKKAIEILDKNEMLFAVTMRQKEKDGTYVGKNKIFFKDGFIQHSKADDLRKGLTAWAEGGASIFRTKMVRLLEGFDELYSPFYWEDIDISYRAYKMGWKVLFDPSIKVVHHHESTIKKYFKPSFIFQTAYKNQLIFFWKNISEKEYFNKHFILLPQKILKELSRCNIDFILGFLKAFKKLPKIIERRKNNMPTYTKTDKEIISYFS